jgi:two-component system response regulator NreC
MRKDRPEIKALLLTMYDDEDYLAEGMGAGANGYILKDSPSEHLLMAIREVHGGGSYLSPRMVAHLVDDFRSRTRTDIPVPRFDTLTSREKEVLKLLAEGNSVKEIASNLDLSLKTVETHKFNLMRKLDIHNKAQLVQYAIQKKIIRLQAAV